MEIRILGELEALDGERQLALGSPQQRLLLAALVLNAGRPLSVDDLMETLWPERAPASAAHTIEVYVSRLRKVLHADGARRLESTKQGYVLRIGRDDLDLSDFEALVALGRAALADGHPVRAAELLREALALWRGEPLGGLHGGPLVRAAAGRIEELRLAALEDRIDADLACGRHNGVIAELELLVEAEPLRERFRGQLMLALYRDGRQADALDAYRAARKLLRDELGLDPSPALQDLERAILNHDARLELDPPVPERRPTVPSPITPLIGRRVELEQVTELIRRDDVRLLTITGAGGIGKTRLALEAARQLEGDFDTQVVFVELAAVSRTDLVGAAIAVALGIKEQVGTPLVETIAVTLSDRGTLLVLDNFEHILEAAPLVSDLLAAAEGVKVLATSRSRLQLYGEHEFPVAPLPVPPPDERSVEVLARFAAVELFVDRARRRLPAFELELENAMSIAEICIRLEGVPLAIELAAARSRTFEPKALLRQLDARLPVLVGGPRDAPERQRSLRATIDWSYDLLDEAERRLFARLSVFAGGSTAPSCMAVCDSDLSTLDSLVEKNLVVREVEEDPRFTLLETIREYAHERLRDSGDLEATRLAHALYFARFAERAEPELRGPAQLESLRRLDAEQANVWAAWAWALDAGRFEPALRLGAALWRYWEARGSIAQARERLDAVLSASAGHRVDARPAALFASGRMALRQGELDHARAVFSEGRALFEAGGDRGGVALCTAGLGWIAHVVGPIDDAIALCRAAVADARASGEPWIVADALNNLGVALRVRDDAAGSRAALEESLAIRRTIGDFEGVTAALNGLALIAIAEDDFDNAERLFTEAFTLSEKRGDLFYAAAKDIVFGYLAFGRKDFARATARSMSALDSCTRNGYRQFTAYALETLAGVAAVERRLREAGRLVGAATAVSARAGTGDGERSDEPAHDWEARAVKRVLAWARHELGESAWDDAVREGRRLQLAEVIASAAEWMAADEQELEPSLRTR